MCAIIGAFLRNLDSDKEVAEANTLMNFIMNRSRERGRDGWGYHVNSDGWINSVRDINRFSGTSSIEAPYFMQCKRAVLIGNLRAEPTTEFVENKRLIDQQPYTVDDWSIVHNGTIANDTLLRTGVHKTPIDSAAIVELLSEHVDDTTSETFAICVPKLLGSYAILAHNKTEPEYLHIAVNYRPVWFIETQYGLFFASSSEYFPEGYSPQMLRPYYIHTFTEVKGSLRHYKSPLIKEPSNKKALVICSGGLDSVVAATFAQKKLGLEIDLLHFTYGCRAQSKEVAAVKAVAVALDVPYHIFKLPIYNQNDSPLLDPHATATTGKAGAEFAHEWVPARNLVLLSVATAHAEANGYEYLVLGNNLEEAGAYPDNEPEFIKRFNNLLPFAIGDGKRLEVLMPVGNLMKHEIVKLGSEIGAPMDKTWSCYNHNKLHCGECGPCFMRKTAFKINKLDEVIEYAPS